jgi:NADPH:quinone reductase-like Zn-dependent oxidoreductase
LSACRRVLSETGKYVLIGHDKFGAGGRSVFGSLPRFMKLMAMAAFVKQLPKVDFSLPPKVKWMALLRGLLETGKLTPRIDRTFRLAEAAEAIRYLESGKARGRIVLTV